MKEIKFGWGYIAIGVLLSLIGICFISFQNALNTLALCIGVIILTFGIGFGAVTLSKRERSLGFAMKIVISIAAIVCGAVTAIVQDGAVMIIANLFCLLLIVDGSFKLQTAILSKRYRLASWWVMLCISVAVIASAFLLAKISPEETTTFTLLSGIIILIDGAANVFSAFYISGYQTEMEIEAYRAGYGFDEEDKEEEDTEEQEAENREEKPRFLRRKNK